MGHTAYIGLGSNLGDREANIAAAVEALRRAADIQQIEVSSLYETEPVGGPPGQARYLNAAARLETALGPDELLRLLLRVEGGLGRARRERWGPRTIDLDLLLYDQVVQDTDELQLPHPRMHERKFVLEPLAELAPTARHPTLKKTIAELLGRLERDLRDPDSEP